MRFLASIRSEVPHHLHPETGYLSRASFKLIDHLFTLPLSIPFLDRIDYVSTISQEGLLIDALERYLHSYVSDYLSAIRTLFYELSRISNHLLAITTAAIDIGSLSSLLLAFEERERIHNAERIMDVIQPLIPHMTQDPETGEKVKLTRERFS